MKRFGIVPLAFVAVLAVACGRNEARDDVGTAGSDPATVGTAGEADRGVSVGDRSFVDKATIAGMTEVELGRMASEKGMSAEVKKFAMMMIEDHTKSGEALKQVATTHNVPQPAAIDEDHRELRDKLAALQGAEFDREYMAAMVEGHEDVVDLLESRTDRAGLIGEDKNAPARAEQSDNPVTSAINQWATTTLPRTRHHLEEARRIQNQLQRNTTN
jgi:putative membrane protein